MDWLVGWWGGGVRPGGGLGASFTKKTTSSTFMYNTPNPPLNDSVIRVIMLSYCDEAAVLA